METSIQTTANSQSSKSTVLSFQQFRELYGKKVAVYPPATTSTGQSYQQVSFFTQNEVRETRVFVSKKLGFIKPADIVRLKAKLCVIINTQRGISILSMYKSDTSATSSNMEIVEGLD